MCEHTNYAVRKCPFLASLAKEHGHEYASSIAIAPLTPVGSAPLPQGTDAVAALASSFRLFHGPEGAVPLAKGPHARSAARGGAGGCPFHARTSASGQTAAASGVASAAPVPGPSAAPQAHAAAAQAPFATISLSNFGKGPNFGDFLRKQLKNHNNSNSKPSSQQRPGAPNNSNSAGKAPHGPGASTSSNSASTGRTGGGSNTSGFKPQRPLGDPGNFPSSSSSGAGVSGSAGGRFPQGTSGSKPPGAAASAAAGSTFSASSSPTLGGSAATTGSSSATSSWQAGSSSAGPSPLQQQRLRGSNNSNTGSSSNTARGGGGSSRANNTSRSGAPDSKGGRGSTGGSISRGTGSSAAASGGGGSGGAPAPSGCPLRKWLGPMAGLVFNEYDKIVCPPAIVAARAALAKTSAVQQLRPQALPVKLVAVAAVVAGVNLPCGAVREHFEKFSVGWFIAVHATIPFVAMLRKAVIMPKYAMLVTIAAAVMGQLVGSRVERARLQYEQQHGPLLPAPEAFFSQLMLSAPQPAASAAAVTPAAARAGPAAKMKNRKQEGAAGRSSSNSRDKHWRERLAADPPVEPAVGARCGSSSSGAGALGGLFARLPTVKA